MNQQRASFFQKETNCIEKKHTHALLMSTISKITNRVLFCQTLSEHVFSLEVKAFTVIQNTNNVACSTNWHKASLLKKEKIVQTRCLEARFQKLQTENAYCSQCSEHVFSLEVRASTAKQNTNSVACFTNCHQASIFKNRKNSRG